MPTPPDPVLTLENVAYVTSSGTPIFQAVISKVEEDGKKWSVTCKIPEADSEAIWGTVVQGWGGGDVQLTLQKLIDLGT